MFHAANIHNYLMKKEEKSYPKVLPGQRVVKGFFCAPPNKTPLYIRFLKLYISFSLKNIYVKAFQYICVTLINIHPIILTQRN